MNKYKIVKKVGVMGNYGGSTSIVNFGRFNLPKLGDIGRLTKSYIKKSYIKSCIKRVGVVGVVFLIVLGMSFALSQINNIPVALVAK